MTTTQPSDGASQARLSSTRRIGFLAIAAAPPMATMIGDVPLSPLRGDGVGLPAVRVSRGMLVAYGATAEVITRATGKAPGIVRGLARCMSAPQASDCSKAARQFDCPPGELHRAISDAAGWHDECMRLRG